MKYKQVLLRLFLFILFTTVVNSSIIAQQKNNTTQNRLHKLRLEKKIADTIMHLPEVVKRNAYVEKQTHNKRSLLCMLTEPSGTDADYFVQVGEDNGISFVPHYSFYVNAQTFVIRYYDIVNDKIQDLASWRKQQNSQ